MTKQHSPGPFSIEIVKGKTYIIDRDGQRIAHVLRIGRYKSLPVEANAKLFAAAGGNGEGTDVHANNPLPTG